MSFVSPASARSLLGRRGTLTPTPSRGYVSPAEGYLLLRERHVITTPTPTPTPTPTSTFLKFTPYLQPSEYATYGVPDATASQVNSACMLVNGYIGMPDGLIWAPDANGMPAYMANKVPTASFSITGPVAPGSSVVLTIPYARFGNQNIGDVVILDVANPDAVEACVVTAASGNTLTLGTVQFAHSGPVTVDFGRAILEEVSSRVRLSRSPVVNILSGFGRYSFGREMRQLSSGYDQYEALLVTNYGQAGVSGWNQLDTTLWDIDFATGSIRMPRYAHEHTRICYVAGWTQANLPGPIKQATANIADALGDDRSGGNIKTLKAGDGTIEWFSSGVMDANTKALLQPYKSMRI